jgi:hypothetical protein
MSTDIEYDLNSLKEALVKCDKNIEIFEDAISREHTTKREYRQMIAVLEQKKALVNDNTNGRINRVGS